MANGKVVNKSTKQLWVVETESGTAIAHVLTPQRESPDGLDADGVRAVDSSPIFELSAPDQGHRSWWKLRDPDIAVVGEDSGKLWITQCALCTAVDEDEFGRVQYDEPPGWGQAIS